MFLDPDDRLAEVQATGMQRGRVVGEVAVTAPNVEGSTGRQDARQVREPGRQALRELGCRQEVVGQRSVLGAELGRLALAGTVGGILDRMRIAVTGEGAEPGCYGIVGAWLDLNVVNRIRIHHLHAGTPP